MHNDLMRQQSIAKMVSLTLVIIVSILNSISIYFFIINKGFLNQFVSVMMMVILLIIIFSYYFAAKGFVKLSGYILIVTLLASILMTIKEWGVDLPIALLSLSMVITISGILLGNKKALLTTIIIMVLLISMSYMEHRGITEPSNQWKQVKVQLDDGLEYSFILLITMIISYLYNREIEHSLRRAKASESALKEERDLLEQRVNERAREIKELQIDRMVSLHHRAESGRLAAGFFHDLMNSLTAVTLSIEQVTFENPIQITNTKQQLQKTITASRDMAEFVSAIRRYTSAPQLEQSISLRQELQGVIRLFNYRTKKINCSINLQIKGPDDVRMNLSHLFQIVNNLLSYALSKYEASALQTRQRKIDIIVENLHHQLSIQVNEYTGESDGADQDLTIELTRRLVEHSLSGIMIIRPNQVNTGSILTVTLPIAR